MKTAMAVEEGQRDVELVIVIQDIERRLSVTFVSLGLTGRTATSNDAWGPTGTDMAEIAKITYNSPSSSADFYEVMDMLDKRLNDKGRMWRHVLKSLK
ncbi:hypothetical protein LTR28_000514, partial [Elasticomyces elasticus]